MVTPIRLKTEIFDQLMNRAGHVTIVDQADALGIDRSTIYNLRNGSGITLDLAMHIASYVGVTVEDLFEPVPNGEAA